jgi:hypothetical protein
MRMERCPGCGRALVVISLAKDGQQVQMRSCTPCDERWWTVDGRRVDPKEALAVKRDA